MRSSSVIIAHNWSRQTICLLTLHFTALDEVFWCIWLIDCKGESTFIKRFLKIIKVTLNQFRYCSLCRVCRNFCKKEKFPREEKDFPPSAPGLRSLCWRKNLSNQNPLANKTLAKEYGREKSTKNHYKNHIVYLYGSYQENLVRNAVIKKYHKSHIMLHCEYLAKNERIKDITHLQL